ncbi:uncharacterized protein LOC115464344 [Microcaecilia unicolor]|uniref:RING-type E3 ubiquitin transferase n=1 Tax=Microcaecilia unicolor TaxID=1415580 RepID=A0A6P7XDI7_9AMPH|nr:uncharacterized protein LOC115464344 [Microcaecilia unicolor]
MYLQPEPLMPPVDVPIWKRNVKILFSFPVRIMAAASSAAENLQEEVSCPICLDYFIDPVSTECGHNYCHSCIIQSWEGIETNFPCPQCRKTSQQRILRVNRQLANITEMVKKLSGCPVRPKEEDRCEKHDEKLKLFCEEDQRAICVVCDRSRDHRSHTTIPIEEAVQEYKEKIKLHLEPLRKELETLLMFKSNKEKTEEKLRNDTEIKREKIESEFEKLYQFLKEEKQILLLTLEEEEKIILQRIRKNVTRLEVQISSLTKLISEIEDKSQQPAAELLKGVKDTLSRCQKVKFPEPEAVSTDLKVDFLLCYPQKLKRMMMEFGEWWMEYSRCTVNVTLDAETAHPELILSKDQKSVRHGDVTQKPLKNSQRFDYCVSVLGCESFTSGRHYWEVEVGDKTDWSLGVCKDSVTKKGRVTLTPGNGYWAVWLRNGSEYKACSSPTTLLPLSLRPRAVGIFLNYEAGKVSFYNADNNSHLFTFTDTFTEKLRPYFCPCLSEGGRNAGTLRIRPSHAFPVRIMAAASTAAENLQEEVSCSICLDYFIDPVSTECGHNYCRSCITQSWEGIETNFPCPQCRKTSQQRILRVNRQLANITEMVKKLSGCSVRPKEEDQCEKHAEKLKLFCEEDQSIICLICRESQDHKSHTVIPIEEAVQEYKEKIKEQLKLLKMELKFLQMFKSNEERKEEDMRNDTEIKRKKIESDFEELYQFLNEEKRIFLLRLEEEEKMILQRIREKVTQLEEQSSSLIQLISEIEEKSQQPAAELLKDVKDTLNRYEKVKSTELEIVSTDLKMEFHLFYSQKLKKMITKFGGWCMAYGRYAVNVTLDLETACPNLILSEDRKSVRYGDTSQNLPYSPQRFYRSYTVLGCEGFTSGRHYWEVEVGDKTDWELGVCKDSVSRNRLVIPTSERGYWLLIMRDGDQCKACISLDVQQYFSVRLRAVGIFLDYEAGKVSFYNADNKAHLYTFTDTFTEKLWPYFNPCFNREGKNAGALRIQPVPDWE